MSAAEKSTAVPVAQFKLVNDSTLDNKVLDTSMAAFGYNTVDDIYTQSKAYQRYIEPLEDELNQQVEYDMDEQDKIWLDDLNKFRNSIQIAGVSYEIFEIIVDRLEKEFLDLQKKLPQKTPKHAFIEDSTCLICNDSECDNSNAIVFCDGCNLAVHQDCYGIPYIPEGQWLCRKCTVSPENPVSCVLCPNEGGAFKQTNNGAWAHVICANWIPETGLSNPVYQEPVEGVDRIPKSRWKLICYICKQKSGACIQCDDRACFVAMHPTCAQKFGLLCKTRNIMQGDQLEDTIVMRALCHRHRPKTVRSAPLFDLDKDASIVPSLGAASTKAARAHSHAFNPGPPRVPQYIIDRILNHIDTIKLDYKLEVAYEVTKYWALKRERRRGAGLIRRLHLEPWSATVNSQHSEADKRQKLEYLAAIRDDLERAKKLADLVIEREAAKQNQVNHLVETIFHYLFPHDKALRLVFERIVALDETELFAEPVSLTDAPNYLDVIKTPMDWSTIYARIDRRAYTTKSQFVSDVMTVYDNALHYNLEGSPIYVETETQKVQCIEILSQSLPAVESFEAAEGVIRMLSEERGVEKMFDSTLYTEPSPEPVGESGDAAALPQPPRSRRSKKSKRKREYNPELHKAMKTERVAKQRAEADVELQRLVEAGMMSSRSMRSSTPGEKREGEREGGRRASASALASTPTSTPAPTPTPKSLPGRLREAVSGVDARSARRGGANSPNMPSKLSSQVLEQEKEEENDQEEEQKQPEGHRKTELHSVKRRLNDTGNDTNREGVQSSGSPSVSNKRIKPEIRTRSSRRSMAAAEVEHVYEKEKEKEREKEKEKEEVKEKEEEIENNNQIEEAKQRKEKFETPRTSLRTRSKVDSTKAASKIKSKMIVDVDKDVGEKAKGGRESRAITPPAHDTPSRPHRQTRQPAEVREAQEQRERYERRQSARKKTKAPMNKAEASSSSKLIKPNSNNNNTTNTNNINNKMNKMNTKKEATSITHPNDHTETEKFTSGSLVWAKWEKYPHFPSEIYDMNDEEDIEYIPPNVIKAKPRSKFECLLVRFFDSKRTWAWVPTHNLISLGWDEVDGQYLDRSVFKNTKTYDGVRLAYRRAMAALQ
ncbi:hypothetical protein E3P92_03270 [Wallemia ichthyophaga]|uniref:Peregrin n=1 Tax=Wallemia ichthyophaga (strain EXF-994 / CBS 113033) TaxID=1299270 RepID=R9ABP3_WALI9|nr:Peregrin [Wallemia ichthyophaga EXF-994]EOQ99494.1 Peregrin [Wallemia ichthyophaga EXF-994]TIB10231.1 hypothetical protein E3P92_03270 [Wallemia ichthyophaga]